MTPSLTVEVGPPDPPTLIVIKSDIGVVVVNELEFDAGHVGPGLKSPAGQLFPRFGQGSDIGS